MALALPLLLALLGTSPGLGAPGGGCGVPPSAWCQDWVTALRCGALGRCPHLGQGPPEVVRDPPEVMRDPPEDICKECQQIVAYLSHISNQTTVEVLLEQVMELGCPHVPVPELSCQNMVRGIVYLLLWDIENLKPLVVCARLKLCPALEPGAALALPGLEVPGSHPQGSALSPRALPLPLPLCWLCRSLVARAEAAVPVGAVAAAVAGLCRALPLPVAGACQCLAERYAALALEGLLGRLGPRLLCRLLLACRAGDGGDGELEGTLPPPRELEAIVLRLAECVREEDPRGAAVPALSLPLGPCALGPIFWCSGPAAAQRCQALQHCREHVWL